MPITELFLGAFLNVLFDRLASHELLEFAQRRGIDTLLKKWEEKLIGINQVLDDVEDRQLVGDLGVKSWLAGFRNLAYDIEDLLDELATEFGENKSKAEASTSKARFLLPSCCFNLRPRAFMFDHIMGSKIKEFDDRLQVIVTLKESLRLRENNGQRLVYRPQNLPFPTTHLTEEFFIGREDKKMELLELLSRAEEDRTRKDIKVIAIVGMPGLGKTALAQQVFNDNAVTSYFEVKAWACVSITFDVPSITRSILETISPHLHCEHKTLNWLQDELTKNLSGRKFLIVLDDVWDKNYKNWIFLLKLFQSGAKGSKIIVTTRDFKVASMAGAQPITLEVLSPYASMTLFEFHLLRTENFEHCHNLEVFGQKMVHKCKGLPLAVKELAELLRIIDNPYEWEDILNNKIWDISEDRINILPALKLSYLHLPSNLRRCFAYCAIFPKDYEIQRDELIHWWIAESLVEGKEAKNQWNAGLSYCGELVNKSFFLKSSSNESRFLMHDFVNDLAKLVAGATYFDSGEFEGLYNNASLARHASFIPNEYILPENFNMYRGMRGLRSFISLYKPSRSYNMVFVSQKVLCDLLSSLNFLRVLSLSHYQIIEVPESIGKLRHLRHLNLSYTNIKMLPKSIVELYNLEVLMLRGCEYLIELPRGMEKLINLRYLDITDTKRLKAMPLYIGKCVGLEMMSKFVVGTEYGSRLEELKDLENLGGELSISNLHVVREAQDAVNANLCAKKGIYQLTMQWSTDFENVRNELLEGVVLDSLRPHQNIKNLTIFYYGGIEFPSWLGSPSHDNIVSLCLDRCQRVKALPSLGLLPSLKELYIKGLNAICSVGSEFYGSYNPFPSLITLEFKDMPLWMDWSHCIGTEGVLFPRLEHLIICDCPMLIGRLPSQLSSLIKLKIYSCPSMDASSLIMSLPSLNELDFKGCNEGLLKSLVNMTSLTTLVIEYVHELTCLNDMFTSSLIKLEKLEIRMCEKLMYLGQDRDVIQRLSSLKSLDVESCPEFIYFAAGEGDIEPLSNLETIKLTNCVNLKKLPSEMHTLSSLRDLTVDNCPKLVSFPETGISTSVISLNISQCEMLHSLPIGLSAHLDEPSSSDNINTHSDMTSCLEDLKISKCNSLPASPFSKGRFLPMTLKRLEIRECKGVESLTEINVDCLQSLREILIVDCENLRSLPQGLHTLSQLTSLGLEYCPALELECFPPLPHGISKFSLKECPKIKSLPNQLRQLTGLHNLEIVRCESIMHIPDGGFPPQLQSLSLWGCRNIKQPVREWLAPLTSLEWLLICDSVGGVGEKKDLVLPLPSSLLDLRIYNMEKVERLSISLPPSLRKLWIYHCPKLKELPRDGLPLSLEELWIKGCGILEERCKKGTGRYWPLVHEIPRVMLENR